MVNHSETVITAPIPVNNAVQGSLEAIEPARIQYLKNSKTKLTQIQQELEKLIDAMTQNPSILARVANFWGRLPLWKKITAGMVFILPPLILGIFTQLLVGLVVTAFALITYVGSSVVLDDHYTHTQYSTKNIKSGVTSLAEGLDVIMNSLEQISQALAEQVDFFSNQNSHFSDNLTDLTVRNEELTTEVEKLRQIEKKLAHTQAELESTCALLQESVQEQTAQLTETQSLLNKVTIEYANNQKHLEEKIKELADINASMSAEITQFKITQKTLQASLAIMAETATKDEQQKNAFFNKLDAFIKHNDISLLEMSEVFQREVEQLKTAKNKYEAQIVQHHELIERTAQNVDRMVQIPLLQVHGLYSKTLTEVFSEIPKACADEAQIHSPTMAS